MLYHCVLLYFECIHQGFACLEWVPAASHRCSGGAGRTKESLSRKYEGLFHVKIALDYFWLSCCRSTTLLLMRPWPPSESSRRPGLLPLLQERGGYQQFVSLERTWIEQQCTILLEDVPKIISKSLGFLIFDTPFDCQLSLGFDLKLSDFLVSLTLDKSWKSIMLKFGLWFVEHLLLRSKKEKKQPQLSLFFSSSSSWWHITSCQGHFLFPRMFVLPLVLLCISEF